MSGVGDGLHSMSVQGGGTGERSAAVTVLSTSGTQMATWPPSGWPGILSCDALDLGCQITHVVFLMAVMLSALVG